MILLDKLAYSSPIRQRSPAVKTLFSVGSLLLCVGFRSPIPCLITLFVMAVCTLRFANLSFFRYLRLMTIPLAFLCLSCLAVLFFFSSSPQGIVSVPVFSHFICISKSSFTHWYELILTAFSSVSCLYFLILTTPVTDLLTVLRQIHCPSLILELMLLIYRAIFILLDLADAIQTAQNCRLGNRTFRSKLSCMGQMLCVLLVRSLKKSSILYDAMESRLYDGTVRVLEEHSPANPCEIVFCALWLCTCLGLCLIFS